MAFREAVVIARGASLNRIAAGVIGCAVLVAPVAASETHTSDGAEACAAPGQWFDPASAEVLGPNAVLSRASESQVVLLGETHTSKEDHLWQAHTLAGLYAHQPNLVVGFEAFPRRVQETLDEWSTGSLSGDAFLTEVRWDEVWGYDADFYMPLFDFARQNRVPVVALNVERTLVSKVGRDGWAAVPVSAREGLSDPAPASAPYRDMLAEVYAKKAALRGTGAGDAASADANDDAETALSILEEPGFNRFVEAQLTWDRAMAEALAKAVREAPGTLVVGVLGRGHVEHGYGVPHQLADLGIENVTTLLPVQSDQACAQLEISLADAVFFVDANDGAEPAPDRPRLGVFIEPAADGGVLLSRVVEGSIAEAAELSAGDIVMNAAGAPLRTPQDLVAIIERQAPGTWLPLDIRRDGEDLTIVAKFPPDADLRQ